MWALFILLWLVAALSAPAFGVPANGRVRTFTQPDGTKFQAVLRGDEFYSYHQTPEGDTIRREPSTGQWRYARPRSTGELEITSVPVGMGEPPASTQVGDVTQWLEATDNTTDRRALRILGAPDTTRTTGTIRAVLLLVNFSDTSTNYAVPDFNDLMNAAGGVQDYYYEVSYGKLTLQFDVYGWFSLPHSREYYGRNSPDSNKDDPNRVHQMIKDAIAAADPNVDFSQYDGNEDGWVDLVVVAHQGQGEEQCGAESDCIWSCWQSSYMRQVDGVGISDSFTAPERHYDGLTTIGVYCHEIGHFFRLPDLYDTIHTGMIAGIGDWSVMGSGNWLGLFDRDGSRPCHFDPWCKYVLGWVTPEVIDRPRSGITLPSFDASPTVLLIPVDPYQDGEYFLVANRYGRLGGFDECLSIWPGVLILHVDDYVPNNNNATRKKVDVEEADGFRDLDTGANPEDNWCDLYMWPESVFDDASEPNSRDNDGVSTGITIRHFTIADDNETVICDVTPRTSLSGYALLHDFMGDVGQTVQGWDGDDYGCVRFRIDRAGVLERVKTQFRYDGTMNYTVNVYSGWLNNRPTGLLTTQSGSHTGAGPEEIVLLKRQAFAEGAEFAVEIEYNTGTGNQWPIVPVVFGRSWSGRTYIRSDSKSAYTQGTTNGHGYDALIRADLGPLSSTTFRLDVRTSAPGRGFIKCDPNKPAYNCFEVVNIEAVCAPGYIFTGWSGDLVSTSNPVTITMDGDKTMIANFLSTRGEDLVDVNDAPYPPWDGLAPGSHEAQERQRQAVQELGLPLEVQSRKTGIAFRLVPAGKFTMGSPSSELERDGDEIQHEVMLTQAFYCAKFEVTRAQWEQIKGRAPFDMKNSGQDAPVVSVSWNECQDFLKKLCQMEQVPEGTYRMLTEAEWEYACRAGTQTPFCYGNDLDSTLANFNGNYPYGSGGKGEFRNKPVQVGSFQPNAWGLCDMHGNTAEWCEDWFGEYSGGAVVDPPGPASGDKRIARGGSWTHPGRLCRSAGRIPWYPAGSMTIGLRVARTLPSRP